MTSSPWFSVMMGGREDGIERTQIVPVSRKCVFLTDSAHAYVYSPVREKKD